MNSFVGGSLKLKGVTTISSLSKKIVKLTPKESKHDKKKKDNKHDKNKHRHHHEKRSSSSSERQSKKHTVDPK